MDPTIEHYIFEISRGLFTELKPTAAETTQRAFFTPGHSLPVHPSTETRTVDVPLPAALRALYAKFPPNVEFRGHGEWTLMSEAEIARRHAAMCAEGQSRCVDFALRYAGMGHVDTCGYDPQTDSVFLTLDGGSNGWDRAVNHAAKVALDVHTVAGRRAFEAWWAEEEEM